MRQARVVLGAFLCHDEHWCVSFRLHPEVRPRALRPMPISCLSLGVTVTGMSRQSPFLDSLLQIVYIQMIGSHPNYLLVNVYIVWGRRNILCCCCCCYIVTSSFLSLCFESSRILSLFIFTATFLMEVGLVSYLLL